VTRSGEGGFTLVELLVALLIFGLIAGAGVAILTFSVRAQGATAAKLDQVSALARAGSLLGSDLGQALDRPARDEGGVRLPAFTGDAASMRLVRGGWTNLDGLPRPSIQKVAWRAGDGTLERVSYPMVDGAAAPAASAIATGVSAVRLRYRFRGAWSDRWDGALAPLPDAVEMTVVRRDRTGVRQLFLVGTGYARAPG
jgi:general secretion pathway protein J